MGCRMRDSLDFGVVVDSALTGDADVLATPMSLPEPPTSPDRREWLVPAGLALAVVLVIVVSAMPSRGTTVVQLDGGATGPAPTEAPPTEVEASHVLVMYRGSMRAPDGVTRTQTEARQRAEEVLRKARSGQDIATLARVYSDEPRAGDSGGSLGRFGRGSMVPAFEQAAFGLRVGQVSEIVETPFGYHVIKRTR